MNNSGFSYIQLILEIAIINIISLIAINQTKINKVNIDAQLVKLFLERNIIYSIKSKQLNKVTCDRQILMTDYEKISINSRINCGEHEFWLSPNAISPRTIQISDKDNSCNLTISLRGRIRKSCEKG